METRLNKENEVVEEGYKWFGHNRKHLKSTVLVLPAYSNRVLKTLPTFRPDALVFRAKAPAQESSERS